MTTIKRVYSEPSDILAIQFECRKCRTTISYPLKDWKPKVLNCSNCMEPLIKGPIEVSRELFALTELASAFDTLLKISKKLPFQ